MTVRQAMDARHRVQRSVRWAGRAITARLAMEMVVAEAECPPHGACPYDVLPAHASLREMRPAPALVFRPFNMRECCRRARDEPAVHEANRALRQQEAERRVAGVSHACAL